VIIPVVGLLVLVGRAEWAVRSGPSWHVAISGYDPRDLLHGHYLRYRFDFTWAGESTCGPEEGKALTDGCCLCLTRTNERGIDPTVRQVSCDTARQCDGWLRSETVRPPLRHFVPEDRARELELALAERQASLELVCTPAGKPAIRELYLDGRPWREALAE
jgi:hypothetical protein